jgi:hypothetical protein
MEYGGGNGRILWHPAFAEALRAELEDWQDILDFLPEVPLNSAPSVMDMLVIKKRRDAVIGKNIARIFRVYNIIEYKSPEAYVSVWDFIKVYGYACSYSSANRTDFRDMSVTFAGSRYPKKLFGYLREERGFTVEEAVSGIYHVIGDKLGLAIQFICRNRLSGEENLWLKGLGRDLGVEKCGRILAESEKKGTALGAYMDAVLRANPRVMTEAMRMNTTADIRKELWRVDFIREWIEKARAEGEANARAEQERLKQEKEWMAGENERLRQEIAALRRAAES